MGGGGGGRERDEESEGNVSERVRGGRAWEEILNYIRMQDCQPMHQI